MSGIISEAELLAVTLIFAAALVATGINLFLLLNMSTRYYLDKYVSAVVSQTEGSLGDLLSREEVSFTDIAKALRSDSLNISKVDIYFKDMTPSTDLSAYEAYYVLFKYANRFGKVSYSEVGTDYVLEIVEVLDR